MTITCPTEWIKILIVVNIISIQAVHFTCSRIRPVNALMFGFKLKSDFITRFVLNRRQQLANLDDEPISYVPFALASQTL